LHTIYMISHDIKDTLQGNRITSMRGSEGISDSATSKWLGGIWT
jgi:hypothetical protein